jgi:hypothetical protein
VQSPAACPQIALQSEYFQTSIKKKPSKADASKGLSYRVSNIAEENYAFAASIGALGVKKLLT